MCVIKLLEISRRSLIWCIVCFVAILVGASECCERVTGVFLRDSAAVCMFLPEHVRTESDVVCLISASKCERCLCMLTVSSVPQIW